MSGRNSRTERKYSLPTNKPKINSQKARLIKGKYLCIVTGAGYGLGRAIASLAFQDQGILPDAWAGSRLALIDIDEEALNETAGKKMRQFLAHRKIGVDLFTVDLGDISEIGTLMNTVSTKYEKDFERVILVNTAGTIGNITKLLECAENPPMIQKFWDLNITSKICMANQVCRIFAQQAKTVVDTTGYDLNQPTPSLGLACMASSAITTFDAIFAKENPNVRVLHYVTDRLDNTTTHRIAEKTENPNLREEIKTVVSEGKLTSPLEAAKRLIKALETTTFKKGEVMHVDAKSEE